MTTKLRTKHDQLEKKHGELEIELSNIREKIITTRRELGGAVLNDGDGSSAKITRMETALSKLEDREQGLTLALGAGRVELEDYRDQMTRADFKQDQAEMSRIGKRLNDAALAYIKRNYQDRDDLSELVELHKRARLLSVKHDKLSTVNITKSGQVIGAINRTIVPLSRSIEIFALDLVEKAGERRRF